MGFHPPQFQILAPLVGSTCLKIGERACFRCPGYFVWHSAARPEGCWSPMSHSVWMSVIHQGTWKGTGQHWDNCSCLTAASPTYRRTTVSQFCKKFYYVLILWAKLLYSYFKINCLKKLAIQLATHFFSPSAHESELQIKKKTEPILRDELRDHSNGTCRASEFVRAFIL